jgi:hypothetical protein
MPVGTIKLPEIGQSQAVSMMIGFLHMATLLSDGRVLAAGGITIAAFSRMRKLYDPGPTTAISQDQI